MSGDNGSKMLAGRIEAALDDVVQLEAALSSLAGLRRAPVDRGLERSVERRRRALDGIRSDFERDGSSAGTWTALRSWREESAELFEESLAYVEGALMREHSVAAEVCELADALLEDLSDRTLVPWSRFTVLAGGEYVDRLAGVVRVRFPEASIWTLPMAAHEFGHTAIAHWGREMLMRAAAETAALPGGPAGRAHLEEHAADAFASWVTGPAFPLACLHLRFDPAAATEDDRTHPSVLRRMHVILRVLDGMRARAGPLAPVPAEELRAAWTDALVAAGAPLSSVPEPAAAELDALADALCTMLEDRAPPTAVFHGWFAVERLTQGLGDRRGAPASDGADPWDVIGAAWTRRAYGIEDAYELRRIGDQANELCRAVLAQRQPSRLVRGR